LFTIPGKPKLSLAQVRDRSNRNVVPIEVNQILARIFKPLKRIHGNSLRTHGLRVKAKYPLTRATLRRYLDFIHKLQLVGPDVELLENLYSGDLVWDEIKSITPEPAQECFDIEVCNTHNFLLDGIISHNSTNLSRSEVLEAISRPYFQILYVAPLQQQSYRYSTLYLSEAISSCDYAIKLQKGDEELGDGKIVKSVAHKAFSNGAGIQMSYAKTSPDRARGITADMIDFDEVQDHLADHVPIVKESLSNSAWGICRYTGTAKTTDNLIDHLFNQSSMSEWTCKCSACGHYNQPTKDNDVLRMIHIDGPVCTKCRKKGLIRVLDIRKGFYVAGKPDRENEFLGLHVPQIVVPAIVFSPRRWQRLIRKVLKLPPSIIYTEILGISSDVGVRLISQENIDECCTLGTHVECRSLINTYLWRVVAIDWGISEITSYTVVAVIGFSQQGTYDVLFAKRYVGQDIEEIIADICRIYAAYQCHYASADFGVGFTNNKMLSNRGLQVIQIQYVTQNVFMTFNPMHGQARWMVDRNTALSTMFFGIRNKNIRFCAVEDSKEYTVDLLSPYESVNEESAGIVKKRFLRDPSRPDDFAHSLTFGLLVLMYLVDDQLLKIRPDHAIPNGFPEDGVSYDVISQMSGRD